MQNDIKSLSENLTALYKTEYPKLAVAAKTLPVIFRETYSDFRCKIEKLEVARQHKLPTTHLPPGLHPWNRAASEFNMYSSLIDFPLETAMKWEDHLDKANLTILYNDDKDNQENLIPTFICST